MVYLDNAATTFPKPFCVSREITNCINNYCGNPGRSGHKLSLKAAEKIYECRESIADFFGSSSPENVIFTLNTTYALNIAIKTLYTQKSHVLISNMEHNSVLRPIDEMSKNGIISYSVFNVLQSEEEILREIKEKTQDDTKMLIMTHASNVIGSVFPINAIGKYCKRHKITFIVDAAQSAGSIKINIKDSNIDALCVPAHKGLYGPQGLGFVVFGDTDIKRPFIIGGNGANSLSIVMGVEPPESFEAGTLPTPLIVGLNSSLSWINRIGVENINKHEKALAKKLSDNLRAIKGSVVFGNSTPQTGIVLYKNKNVETDLISRQLDRIDICTRGGFHCSPLAHKALGTGDGGALRISIGYFNNLKDIQTITNAIYKICK